MLIIPLGWRPRTEDHWDLPQTDMAQKWLLFSVIPVQSDTWRPASQQPAISLKSCARSEQLWEQAKVWSNDKNDKCVCLPTWAPVAISWAASFMTPSVWKAKTHNSLSHTVGYRNIEMYVISKMLVKYCTDQRLKFKPRYKMNLSETMLYTQQNCVRYWSVRHCGEAEK